MESFDDLADEISELEGRVSDAIFEVLRAQMRSEDVDQARETEKRLAKVRRSLQKAEFLLRRASDD